MIADHAAERRRRYLSDILHVLEPSERRELIRLFGKVAAVHAEPDAPIAAAGRGA